MDCLSTQGLISDALDRMPVDAIALAEAKSHCQSCPTCSVFVRTLLLVKNSRLPEPPEGIVDRVMVAVRAEAAFAQQRADTVAAQAEATAQAEASALAAAAMAHEESPIPGTLPTAPQDAPAATPASDLRHSVDTTIISLRRWVGSLSRRELALWAGSAAILVAAVGITASAGIRVLTTDPSTVAEKTAVTDYSTQRQLAAPAPESGAIADSAPMAAATPVSVITVEGVVFALSGPSTVATEGLRAVGSAVSALGGDAPPGTHAVLRGDDPNRVYLADDANQQLLAFDRVVRTYKGAVYQLTSAAVSDFGAWPTLPSGIPTPAAEDGSPAFRPLGEEPPGARVFRLTTSGAETGIAVAPGTGPQDPARGNPNWTWWTPVR